MALQPARRRSQLQGTAGDAARPGCRPNNSTLVSRVLVNRVPAPREPSRLSRELPHPAPASAVGPRAGSPRHPGAASPHPAPPGCCGTGEEPVHGLVHDQQSLKLRRVQPLDTKQPPAGFARGGHAGQVNIRPRLVTVPLNTSATRCH